MSAASNNTIFLPGFAALAYNLPAEVSHLIMQQALKIKEQDAEIKQLSSELNRDKTLRGMFAFEALKLRQEIVDLEKTQQELCEAVVESQRQIPVVDSKRLRHAKSI